MNIYQYGKTSCQKTYSGTAAIALEWCLPTRTDLYLHDLAWWIVLLISVGIAVVAAVFVQLLLVPRLRKAANRNRKYRVQIFHSALSKMLCHRREFLRQMFRYLRRIRRC